MSGRRGGAGLQVLGGCDWNTGNRGIVSGRWLLTAKETSVSRGLFECVSGFDILARCPCGPVSACGLVAERNVRAHVEMLSVVFVCVCVCVREREGEREGEEQERRERKRESGRERASKRENERLRERMRERERREMGDRGERDRER